MTGITRNMFVESVNSVDRDSTTMVNLLDGLGMNNGASGSYVKNEVPISTMGITAHGITLFP